MFDDLEPRPKGGEALKGLVREDLDPFSVEDLQARIYSLTGEVERARAAIERKQAKKSAADALFSFRS